MRTGYKDIFTGRVKYKQAVIKGLCSRSGYPIDAEAYVKTASKLADEAIKEDLEWLRKKEMDEERMRQEKREGCK
jgi:hypothetical protein